MGSGAICSTLDCFSVWSVRVTEDLEDSPGFSNQDNSDIAILLRSVRTQTKTKKQIPHNGTTTEPHAHNEVVSFKMVGTRSAALARGFLSLSLDYCMRRQGSTHS